MEVATNLTTPARQLSPVTFLELELTNRCQLACTHCYSGASPTEGHGTMTLTDWLHLIDSAPAAGIETVQAIGGEPTMHPDFLPLMLHALQTGLHVQVYSNLYKVSPALWDLYSRPGVTLATSYYSDTASEHDKITGRAGSHKRTRAAIGEALQRDIALKVAVIDLGDPNQRAQEAHAEMIALGVPRVGPIDRVRAVGRATDAMAMESNVGELCGQCGDGRAAVSWDGDVRMCVLSRFLPAGGNVRSTPLATILRSEEWNGLLVQVPRHGQRACKPGSDGNDCSPAETICESNALILPMIPSQLIRPNGSAE
ncbi:radical SAM protein [Nonomuraea sp. NPDC050556]|uniref:radical SAM protein n=1 Tax=Nonomuraea sp. NPDC050556 TaxID=3364369 RepID=UPI0037904D16